MSIKALCFDYGNTIVSIEMDWKIQHPKNIAGMTEYLKPLVKSQELAELTANKFHQNKHAYATLGRKNNHEYPSEDVLMETLRECQAPELSAWQRDEAVRAYFRPERNNYVLVSQCHEVLDALKTAGYKLAIISNASSSNLIRDEIQERNLTEYFDFVTVSSDHFYRKPLPEIYNMALNALGVEHPSAVMVGDVPAYDVEGPKAIGMKAILATYVKSSEGLQYPSAVTPDGVAETFADIPQIIHEWK